MEELLPGPGELLVVDYRKERAKAPARPAIRLIQWNIERGYKLDAIIAELKAVNADIIALQEVDIGCERSASKDQMAAICSALCMKGAFVTEFEEKHSPLRLFQNQGGGVHGNAILSRFDFDPHVVSHEHHPYDWEKHGHRIGEPREGLRFTIAANVVIEPGFDIRVYSTHLEVFTGIIGRIRQFNCILRDAARHCHNPEQSSLVTPYQAILGDLNTLGHGIARLSPLYCRDGYRWRSIGMDESRFWLRYYLSFYNVHGARNTLLQSTAPATLLSASDEAWWTEEDVEKGRNPGFYDPFSQDVDEIATLINYKGAFRGKLDWCLLRCLRVVDKGTRNDDYAASDHRMLWVDVERAASADVAVMQRLMRNNVGPQTNQEQDAMKRLLPWPFYANGTPQRTFPMLPGRFIHFLVRQGRYVAVAVALAAITLYYN